MWNWLASGHGKSRHASYVLLADSPPGDQRDPHRSLLEQAYKADSTPHDVLQALARGDGRHPELT